MFFWLFSTVLIALCVALIVVDKLISAPKYKEGASDHFDGKKFINLNGVDEHHYGDVLKWWCSGNDKGSWDELTKDDCPPAQRPARMAGDGEFRVTFINHATFLLQF